MKRYILLGLALVTATTGCSVFRSDRQALSVTCNVPETILSINGERYSCPAKVEVMRNRAVLVEAEKDGYDTFRKNIDYHLNATGKLDVVGTILWYLPAIGLMNAGAWDLDQTEVNVKLFPANKGNAAL